MNKTLIISMLLVVAITVIVAGSIYKPQQNKNSGSVSTQTNSASSGKEQQIYVKMATSRLSMRVGETFQITVSTETGNIEKNGAHILLKFDPKIVQVIDSDPSKTGTQVLVTPNFYEAVGLNVVDNAKGTVEVIASSEEPYVKPIEPVATIKFKAIGKGKSNFSFDITRTKAFLLKKPFVTYATNFDSVKVEVL